MIIQSESGLDGEKYTLLKNARTDAFYQVVAHRNNLIFGEPLLSERSNDSADFDAVIFDDQLYRIADNTVEVFTEEPMGWATVSGFSQTDGALSSRLAADGTSLAVFTRTASGVSRNTYNGTSWSGWAQIHAISNLTFIAPSTPLRVHVAIWNDTNKLSEFKTVQYNGSSWDLIATDIHWQFTITSMDAVALDEQDVIALSTGIPGAVRTRWANNRASKTIIPSGGIIAFTYKYNTWSDHYEVDILDEVSTFQQRLEVRLSRNGDLAYLTAFGVNGTSRYFFSTLRIYKTANGRSWSRGETLPLTAHAHGTLLLRLGDYCYAVQRAAIYQSDSTFFTGFSSPATQMDITKYITSASSSRADMQQMSIQMTNAENWMAGTVIDGSDDIMLTLTEGYWVDDPVEKAGVQTGLLRVDSVEKSSVLPKREAQITARDLLGNLYNRSMSEGYKPWTPQFVGGDNYYDYTNTGYGGTRHIGDAVGIWKTANNKLKLITSNEEGIAMSVFTSESTNSVGIWNGSDQISFTLAMNDNDEFAGIIFRAHDKDNMEFVRYEQTSDRIRYYRRTAGQDTQIAQSDTLGWQAAGVLRHIRLMFRYGRVRVYTSPDGITWTETLSALGNGQPAGSGPTLPSGYVGRIGKGFSDEDQWDDDPGHIPDFEWEEEVFHEYSAVVFNDQGHLARTDNFLDNSIGYHSIKGAMTGIVSDLVRDFSGSGAWAVTTSGSTLSIYYTTDIYAGSVSWTLQKSYTMSDSTVKTSAKLAADPANAGHCWVAWKGRTGTRIARTTNGSDWDASASVVGSTQTDVANDDAPIGLCILDGYVYVTAQSALLGPLYRLFYAETSTGTFSEMENCPLSGSPNAIIYPGGYGELYISRHASDIPLCNVLTYCGERTLIEETVTHNLDSIAAAPGLNDLYTATGTTTIGDGEFREIEALYRLPGSTPYFITKLTDFTVSGDFDTSISGTTNWRFHVQLVMEFYDGDMDLIDTVTFNRDAPMPSGASGFTRLAPALGMNPVNIPGVRYVRLTARVRPNSGTSYDSSIVDTDVTMHYFRMETTAGGEAKLLRVTNLPNPSSAGFEDITPEDTYVPGYRYAFTLGRDSNHLVSVFDFDSERHVFNSYDLGVTWFDSYSTSFLTLRGVHSVSDFLLFWGQGILGHSSDNGLSIYDALKDWATAIGTPGIFLKVVPI